MNNNDLSILLESKVPIIALETYDESMAIQWLSKHLRSRSFDALRWSVTDGLGPLGIGVELHNGQDLCSAEAVLSHIKRTHGRQVFVLCDLHPFLDEPKVIRMLKDIALNATVREQKVILLSHELSLPPEIQRMAAKANLSLPSNEEILAIIRQEAKAWSKENKHERIRTDSQSLNKLVNNLQGLPHQDVRRLAHGAIADDGAITETDLPDVSRAKFRLMDMEGILHYEFSTEHFENVAGLVQLKQWLNERKAMVVGETRTTNRLDTPKGVLLFGIQGGGKSLAAKAIAGAWGLPLLRMDMGALFNKFIGETEKNMRQALELADLMAPCVLWIDEIEKGLAQQDGDNAISKRLLGTILTWMSERKSKVFLVATSNDISQLPPELIRKGRFDETFFVDLPCDATRSAIFDIHLKKRGHSSDAFDLSLLAEISEGFTGAEIEQAIVSASYKAAAESTSDEVVLNDDYVMQALQATQPLSILMSESIEGLRAWAQGRAVFAN